MAIVPYAILRDRIRRSSFRSRFSLTEQEKAYIAEKGFEWIHAQAVHILTERLAAAFPYKDGSQTPMRGHVIFKAQHATACCCRSCLQKHHNIPMGRVLTEEEILAAADLLVDYLRDKAGDLSSFPVTASSPLFPKMSSPRRSI